MSTTHAGLAQAVHVAKNTPIQHTPVSHSLAPLFDPGIITGHPWVTTYFPNGSQTPRVSTIEHTAWVPADPSRCARYQRTHELGHVTHTPLKTPKDYATEWSVEPQCVMWAEDFRINHLQRYNVASFCEDAMEFHRQYPTHELAAIKLLMDDPMALVDIVGQICSITSATHPTTTIRKTLRSYTKKLRTQLRKHKFSDPTIDNIEREIWRYASRIHSYGINYVLTRKSLSEDGRVYAYSDSNCMRHTRYMANNLQELLNRQEQLNLGSPGHGKPELTEDGSTQWAPTVIITLPLTIPNTTTTSKRRRSGYGVSLRYAYRARTDGRIFTVKRPAPASGSYLLDASGSMCWDSDEITDYLTTLPSATVGFYSTLNEQFMFANGFDFPAGTTFKFPGTRNSGHTYGVVIVAAQNGFRASATDIRSAQVMLNGDNACDGTALRWIATQPQPRVWYSDEGVSGISDESSIDLLKECHEICADHHIQIVNPDNFPNDASF